MPALNIFHQLLSPKELGDIFYLYAPPVFYFPPTPLPLISRGFVFFSHSPAVVFSFGLKQQLSFSQSRPFVLSGAIALPVPSQPADLFFKSRFFP